MSDHQTCPNSTMRVVEEALAHEQLKRQLGPRRNARPGCENVSDFGSDTLSLTLPMTLAPHEAIPARSSTRDAQRRPVLTGVAFLPDGRELRTQRAIARRYPLTGRCQVCGRDVIARAGGDEWAHES